MHTGLLFRTIVLAMTALAVSDRPASAQALRVADVSPVYRYYSPSLDEHFYTTNFSEAGCGGGAGAYDYERVIGYIGKRQFAGTTPLYRSYSSVWKRHAYLLTATPPATYVPEGIVGYIWLLPFAQSYAVYYAFDTNL